MELGCSVPQAKERYNFEVPPTYFSPQTAVALWLNGKEFWPIPELQAVLGKIPETEKFKLYKCLPNGLRKANKLLQESHPPEQKSSSSTTTFPQNQKTPPAKLATPQGTFQVTLQVAGKDTTSAVITTPKKSGKKDQEKKDTLKKNEQKKEEQKKKKEEEKDEQDKDKKTPKKVTPKKKPTERKDPVSPPRTGKRPRTATSPETDGSPLQKRPAAGDKPPPMLVEDLSSRSPTPEPDDDGAEAAKMELETLRRENAELQSRNAALERNTPHVTLSATAELRCAEISGTVTSLMPVLANVFEPKAEALSAGLAYIRLSLSNQLSGGLKGAIDIFIKQIPLPSTDPAAPAAPASSTSSTIKPK